MIQVVNDLYLKFVTTNAATTVDEVQVIGLTTAIDAGRTVKKMYCYLSANGTGSVVVKVIVTK